MSEVELLHWLRVAAARGGFAAAAQAGQLLQKFSDRPQALQHKVEVGAGVSSLPARHACCLSKLRRPCSMPLIETTYTAWLQSQSSIAVPRSHPLQVRSERGVLPEDHVERVATRLGLAIRAVEREDTSAATSILEAYMDDEEDRATKVFAAPIMTHLTVPTC